MILLADSEGPDQTVRMRRLIWSFAVRMCRKTFSHRAAKIRFSILWSNSTNDKIMMFVFIVLSEKKVLPFTLAVSFGDNFHGILNLIFLRKDKQHFLLCLVLSYTQHAKC